MKLSKILITAFFLGLSLFSKAQSDNGTIKGTIYNANNNKPVPFANIIVWQTNIGSTSDFDGNFIFTGLKPGFIRLQVSAVGYEDYITEEIMVTNAKTVNIDIPLQEKTESIDEVRVKPNPFRKKEEAPVSMRTIGISEIEKLPGGNRDISKVIQSFPGVASTPAFRNDVIVRGGGPNENSFYLDGIEIPNLNHFSTQGASGGPVGILNVDFLREAEYYSGAFPASRGDALSSVLEFKQVNGNTEKMEYKATVGASDLALTMNGPLSKNTTMILSARRSYLQFLFSALGLPFLPTYNDAQIKIKSRIDDKNEITFIGLGAIDQFRLNKEANETPEQRYILNYLPVNEQWNYTVGAVYKHYRDKGFDTYVLSRNYLDNTSYKYQNNIKNDSLKILDYSSVELENKFRYEKNTNFANGIKLNIGLRLEHGRYTNSTFRKSFIGDSAITIDYDSELNLFNYGLFGQATHKILNDRLTLSFGIRTDASSYSDEMSNLANQISPRLSASYALNARWFINANIGRYYQSPSYTTLGYRSKQGRLVNKQNRIRYIQADHLVAGLEYLPNEQSRITLEGFYKWYQDYPFSIDDSVSIASKGGDFGTFGDEEVIPLSDGRAYGLELLYRNKLLDKTDLLVSYTLVRSEFKDYGTNLQPTGDYIPTAWDNKHLLNIIATRRFKNNWEFGFKWRFVGGFPYTPYDLEKSSLVSAWNTRGRPYLDYSRFNQKRLDAFHQLDVRLDKGFFFDKWSLMLYLDIQNVYNFKGEAQDYYVNETEQGEPLLIPGSIPPRYDLRRIENEGQGNILPTIGIIVEF
jgi:hypothetical protein